MIDPTRDPRWEAFVQARPDSNVFHTAAWARVLMETYGYEPRYYVVENSAGQIEAGWPCMLVASALTGKRLVSLPSAITASRWSTPRQMPRPCWMR
jgi:hypothetical protein